MHFYLLENPSAGRGRARSFLDDVTRTLIAAGHRVTTYRSRSVEDLATHLRSLATDAADVLLVAGGDGTLHAVVNAAGGPPPWPLGLIPLGTANLAARETGIWPPRDPQAVARALAAGTPWTVDLLEIRRQDVATRWAVTNVGVGLDGALVHAVERARARRKGSGGYARWFAPGLGVMRRFAFAPVEVQVDDAPPRTCVTVMIQNARCYGGFFTLSPEAGLDSRAIEVVMIDARTQRDVVRLVVQAGLGTFHRDRQVRIARARRVHVRASPRQAVQADGDAAGFTDVEVVSRPASMRLWRAPPADR